MVFLWDFALRVTKYCKDRDVLWWYARMLSYVGILVLADQLLSHTKNTEFNAVAPVIIFCTQFTTIYVLDHTNKPLYKKIVRFCKPGNDMLGAFIPLMFFVYMIKLPHDLQAFSGKIIGLWFLSIVISFLVTFYMAVAVLKVALQCNPAQNKIGTILPSLRERLNGISIFSLFIGFGVNLRDLALGQSAAQQNTGAAETSVELVNPASEANPSSENPPSIEESSKETTEDDSFENDASATRKSTMYVEDVDLQLPSWDEVANGWIFLWYTIT